MQNIAIDMCEKFANDRLRNDRALVLLKSDNNSPKKNNKNNVGSAWRMVLKLEIFELRFFIKCHFKKP